MHPETFFNLLPLAGTILVGVICLVGYWLEARRHRAALLRLGKRAEDAAKPKPNWRRILWISLLLAVCSGNFLLLGLMDLSQFQHARLLIVGLAIAAAVWLAFILIKDNWNSYFHWDRLYRGKKPQLPTEDELALEAEAENDIQLPNEVRPKRPRRPSRVRRAEPYKPGWR